MSVGLLAAGLLAVGLAGAPAPSGPDADGQQPLQALPEPDRDAQLAAEAWAAGVAAYGEGRLDDAVVHLEATYRYSGSAGPLFSLGQAHRHLYEQSGDGRQRHLAIVRYRQYLELEPDGKRKIEAERHLAALVPLAQLELEAPEAPPIFTRISVAAEIAGATVRVDGGAAVPIPATLDVAPGRHKVDVVAPGYQPWATNVQVAEGSTATPTPALRPQDADLVVQGPEGSDLYVDGNRVARLPTSAVAVAPGLHQIGVARSGRDLYVREVRLGNGEQHRVDAVLPWTGQRKVAVAAIVGGGLGVVASGVLTGYALDAQRDAQRIEARRLAGSISAAEEARLVGHKEDREQRRTAAIGSGVAAGVVVLAGVLLVVFDAPPVAAQLHRVGGQEGVSSRRRPVAARLGRALSMAAVGASF